MRRPKDVDAAGILLRNPTRQLPVSMKERRVVGSSSVHTQPIMLTACSDSVRMDGIRIVKHFQ
jgi:hypothetical protein